MSILNKMGLFINKKKVADLTPNSNVEIKSKLITVANNTGYVNQGNFNGNVNFGSSKSKQNIQAKSIDNIFGDNAHINMNANLVIENSKIVVDGKEFDIADFTTSETIIIEIHGDVNKVKCEDGNLTATINGDVGKISVNAGNIDLTANVAGNVTNQAGNITIKGDVAGKVSTQLGNIKIK